MVLNFLLLKKPNKPISKEGWLWKGCFADSRFVPCIDKGSNEAFSQPALVPWAKTLHHTIQGARARERRDQVHVRGVWSYYYLTTEVTLSIFSVWRTCCFQVVALCLFIILQNPRTWGLQRLRDESHGFPNTSTHWSFPLAALHSPIGQWHALNIPSGLSYVMFIGVALGCSYVLDCLCRTWHAGRFSFWWKVIPRKENVLCWQAKSDDGPEAKSLQLGII